MESTDFKFRVHTLSLFQFRLEDLVLTHARTGVDQNADCPVLDELAVNGHHGLVHKTKFSKSKA